LSLVCDEINFIFVGSNFIRPRGLNAAAITNSTNTMKIKLEEIESTLVGRIYIYDRKTSAYVVPMKENQHLFTKEQLKLINNQTF